MRDGLFFLASLVALGTASLIPRPDGAEPASGVISAPFARVASLGHPTVAATVLWIWTVQAFADERGPSWVPEAVPVIGALDPRWPVPWAWGALMLRTDGAIEAHLRLLEAGRAAHPDEPWFEEALAIGRHLQETR